MRLPPGVARPRLLQGDGRAARAQSRVSGDRSQAAQTQLPHPQRPRRGSARARMTFLVRARRGLTSADAPRPAPDIALPPRSRGRPPKIERPHALPPSGTPSPSCRRPGNQPESWTEISIGTRAHTPGSANPAPVKRSALGPAGRPTGDRAPPLAQDCNEVIGPNPTTSNNFNPQRLDRPRLHR